MIIKFLGTSHGYASGDRFCSCIMAEVNKKIYFFDCGAPCYSLMQKAGKRAENIRALFCTHFHSDHICGAPELITAVDSFEKDSSIKVFLPEEKGKTVLINFLSAMDGRELKNDRIEITVFQDGLVYEDENVRVTAFRTKHLEHIGRPAYGFAFEAENKRVIFTGDMSNNLKGQDFPEVAMESYNDLIVCEAAHFGLDKLEPYLEKCRCGKFAFTHVYPISKYSEIELLKGKYGFELLTPNDGDEITV